MKSSVIDHRSIYTSPIWGVETLAKLVSIYLYLDKISKKHYLKITSLSKQQALNSLLDDQYLMKTKSHHLSISNLTFI